MKLLLSLALSVSSFAFAAFTEADLTALKNIGYYYVLAETTGDDWAKLMCPAVMGVVVSAKHVQVMEARQYRGELDLAPIGIMDKEVSISYYAWNFESKDTNGGGHKFTSWNQISDGLSRPTQDWLFRNEVFQFSNTLSTAPNIRLVQTMRIRPYTMAFVRAGKDRVVTSELISQAEGTVLMRRRVDGKEVRTCTYARARKDQLPGNGE